MKTHKPKIAAFLIGITTITLALPAHAAPKSAPCLIVRNLSGNNMIATVENWIEAGSFTTYLARNAKLDRQGNIDPVIKFELLPVPWGFDLATITGERFAHMTKEDGAWIVVTGYKFGGTCLSHKVTLRMDKDGSATVLDNGKTIGRIGRFPVPEMKP